MQKEPISVRIVTAIVGSAGVLISFVLGFKTCRGHMNNVSDRDPDGILGALWNLLSGTLGSLLLWILISCIGGLISWKVGWLVG